jgi:peptidoglycan hydrolase FlgJ
MSGKIGDTLVSQPAAAPRNDPAKVRDAACQFESLLMGQLMRSMRESNSGWLGDEEDQAASTATEMAEEQFAKALARQGGLGLANMVVSGLQGKDASGR